MQSHRVITFIADDRPGLIESIADVIAAHEGSWLESRMANLAGKFAGIVRLSLPGELADAFDTALNELERSGLTLILEEAGQQSEPAPPMRAFRLEILGHDRPGIVREFSTALAMRRINVFEMRSDITSAPMSADPLFTASADIHVPADIDLDELRERLEIIADELLIEYTLSHRT